MNRVLTPDGLAIYEVESRTRQGTTHRPVVDLNTGAIECPCEDYVMHRRKQARAQGISPDIGTIVFQCHHLRQAIADCMQRGDIQVQTRSPFPVPNPLNQTLQERNSMNQSTATLERPAQASQPIPTEESPQPGEDVTQYAARLFQANPVNASSSTPPQAALPVGYLTMAADLDEVLRRQKDLLEFKSTHMKEGEDYGLIPGASKPSLFKPGAEKLCVVYGLAPIVTILKREEDWQRGFLCYEVKVTLLHRRTNCIVAEGVGSCNSRERRYKNQDAGGVANTLLKMAKKRATVDATLSATGASGIFTQDVEDLDLDDRSGKQSVAQHHAQHNAAANGQANGHVNGHHNGHHNGQYNGQANGHGNGQAAPAVQPQQPAANRFATPGQVQSIVEYADSIYGRGNGRKSLEDHNKRRLEEFTAEEAGNMVNSLRIMSKTGVAPEAPVQRDPAAAQYGEVANQGVQNGSPRRTTSKVYDPAVHGNEPCCPKCGGAMWDNRRKIANGTYATNRPYFACRRQNGDPDCGGALWAPRDDVDQAPSAQPQQQTGPADPHQAAAINAYFDSVRAMGLLGNTVREQRALGAFTRRGGNLMPPMLTTAELYDASEAIRNGTLRW